MVQGLGLGRTHRNFLGALSDADKRDPRAGRTQAFKRHAARAAYPGRFQRDRDRSGAARLLAYQGDGNVTAGLVYVNYGMQDDYKTLQRLGVSVKGKIVIARYGGGWRGLKPKLAQDHGAIGCIIYSDPADDGYSVDETYPAGPMRPPHGMQRGSVADMPSLSRRSADAWRGCHARTPSA